MKKCVCCCLNYLKRPGYALYSNFANDYSKLLPHATYPREALANLSLLDLGYQDLRSSCGNDHDTARFTASAGYDMRESWLSGSSCNTEMKSVSLGICRFKSEFLIHTKISGQFQAEFTSGGSPKHR